MNINIIVQDVRYAIRRMRREPVFSIAVVASLAIGIGANTAVFSVMDAVLLRPLPFADDHRLVAIWQQNAKWGGRNSEVALANYDDWRKLNRSFVEIGAIEPKLLQVTGSGEAEEISGAIATSGLFAALGAKPMYGRCFAATDDQPGAPKTVLLSYSLWVRHYGARADIVGTTTLLNGEPHTIIGVLPRQFQFPDSQTEAWVPIGSVYPASEWANRDRNNLMVVARLRDGISIRQARTDIASITANLRREYPITNATVSSSMEPLREHFVGNVRHLYTILFAAVAAVLLITCANLANLMLSRATRRTRQAALTMALGGKASDLIRPYLIESCLLSVPGGMLGLFVAAGSFHTLQNLVPPAMAGFSPLSLDYRVLAFTFCLSVAAGILFGTAPALHAARVDPGFCLKEASGQAGTSARAQRLRTALVCMQIALSFTLLIGSALLLQAFARLRAVDLGFEPANVLTLKVRLPVNRYESASRQMEFRRRVLEEVGSLSGVKSAGFTTGVPLVLKGAYTGIRPENSTAIPVVNNRSVTAGYLRTIGTTLRQGRGISDSDSGSSPRVAVVNETMARSVWPGQSAIGKRFQMGMGSEWITVVGIAGDIRQAGLDLPPKPEMYLPFAQQPEDSMALAVRTQQNPLALAPAVRRAIRRVDPNLPVMQLASMEQVLATEVFQRRLQTTLLTALAAIALLVAVVGIYSVIAYVVEQRTREIGIRMALGARRADILSGFLFYGLRVTAFGILGGAAAALALTRFLAALLFGIGPRDPATFVCVSLAVALVASVAVMVPALNASRVDPILTLRYE